MENLPLQGSAMQQKGANAMCALLAMHDTTCPAGRGVCFSSMECYSCERATIRKTLIGRAALSAVSETLPGYCRPHLKLSLPGCLERGERLTGALEALQKMHIATTWAHAPEVQHL